MRMFLAVSPDQDARDGLVDAVDRARKELGEASSAWRWTAVGSLHVTLHFLGDVTPAAHLRLREVMAPPLDCAPFTVEMGAWGQFPPRGRPSVLWMGLEAGADFLVLIHRQLADRLRSAGFATEERAFTPHLTVARHRRDERGLRSFRLPAAPPRPIRWHVADVQIFESELRPEGARHRVDGLIRLGAPGDGIPRDPPSH